MDDKNWWADWMRRGAPLGEWYERQRATKAKEAQK